MSRGLGDVYKRQDKDAQVLDLGCGTGKMARKLAREGYQVTAVDNSMDMLEIAASEEDDHILYVLQDMVSLELPQQVDAAVSICDCMNYILEEEDLKEAFRRVREFLKEDGVFVFDMNSHYKYKEILACNTFAEDREDASFIWDNFYDEEERINEYQLSLFIQNEQGTYNKYEELHLQKAYEQEEVVSFLYEAGFSSVCVLDAETMDEGLKGALSQSPLYNQLCYGRGRGQYGPGRRRLSCYGPGAA